MDLHQLKCFKTIADQENMTSASTLLHIAQPALSRTLHQLEDEVGLPLFDRIGKRIYLNNCGKILLKHTNSILNELEDALLEIAEQNQETNQKVSLSMYAGSKLLPDLIKGFQQKYPNINLQIMQQDIASENAELCDITIYSSIAPEYGSTSVPLMEEGICLALPTSNPLSKRQSIKLAEVSTEPFICLYKGKGLRKVTDEFCRMAGFSPNIVLESDSPSTVRDLIAVGMGLAFIPKISWSGMAEHPAVTLVEISEPHCKRYVNMAWRNTRYKSRASILLRQYLIEFFAEVEKNSK